MALVSMSVIQAELRHLNSTSVPDVELERFEPAAPTDVCIGVTVYIGPKGQQGEDLFDFDICTPRALERRLAGEEPGRLFGRHWIIVGRYSYEVVRFVIERLRSEARGPDWQAVAARLARYGAWEFEDYREAPLSTATVGVPPAS
jgi:hypothetical protein